MEKIFEDFQFHGTVKFFNGRINLGSFDPNTSAWFTMGHEVTSLSGVNVGFEGAIKATNIESSSSQNTAIRGFAIATGKALTSIYGGLKAGTFTCWHSANEVVASAHSIVADLWVTGTGAVTDAKMISVTTPYTPTSIVITDLYGLYVNALNSAKVTNAWGIYQVGASDVNFFAGVSTFAKGLHSTAFSATPDDSEGTVNTIPAGVNSVDVGAVTNDVNDFIVLPALAGIEVGHTIKIACNAGTAFEMRTPLGSGEKINTVDCDGSQEYLCTDTELITVTKVSTTDGWVATAQTALGAIATAVVPD
jgi:hypothetical protein